MVQRILMGNFWLTLDVFLLLVLSCHCQTSISITQPTLISVTPVNSTALTVSWQFADPAYDQSTSIQISITFYEFYVGYNRTYGPTNYNFTSTIKNITNLTRNFELVNAYYYVCFSPNSTIVNTSYFVAVVNNCRLARTCLRSNTACPAPSSLIVSATSVTSTSFVVSFLWPSDLPFSPTSFTARLLNNSQTGTPLAITQNSSYTISPYQFTGLQARTSYTVNATVTYSLLSTAAITNVTTLTVTTSASAAFFSVGDALFRLFFFSVMLFFSTS